MATPFDHLADNHDSIFTKSVIAQLQRRRVWHYVESIVPDLRGLEVLELNAGTGEDAAIFGHEGFNIMATDVSIEMLKASTRRVSQFSMQHHISSRYLDLDSFDEAVFEKKFDMVFCNFGTLNFVQPQLLKKLIHKLPLVLKPGGRFIAVVMPKLCIWEFVYHLLRFNLRKALRRMTSSSVPTNSEGAIVDTWFYSPSQITSWSRGDFKVRSLLPVGFALPPSYLEPFFKVRRNLLFRLNALEKTFAGKSSLASLADHYLIDLQLR